MRVRFSFRSADVLPQRSELIEKQLDQVEEYSLNPCWNGLHSSWCCNNQQETSCCINNGGSFAFNLTSLGFSSQQSHSNPIGPTCTTAAYGTTTVTGIVNATSCPVGKSAVIGSSVGAFFAAILIAGLLGLYLASRRLRKQNQEAVPDNTASYVSPRAEGRAELQTTYSSMARPGHGTGKPKYEIDGREVGSLR